MSDTVELLQHLIRNGCVNDGAGTSGNETPSAELLRDYLGTGDLSAPAGLPHRGSLVARLEGTDPTAPTLLLLAHTDVVPIEPQQWSRDPFGGELVQAPDGTDEVWGRGAVDMLNQTAAMAVAFRRLAARRRPLPGTLIFAAVADEETGGWHGTQRLLDDPGDPLRADAVLTEAGGTVTNTASGPRLSAMVGEKGMVPTDITVHGRAGHGSLPLLADNALVTAAEVIRRIAEARPPTHITEVWREWVAATIDDPELGAILTDEQHLWEALHSAPSSIPHEHRALTHACTHTTYSPTMAQASTKNNVIPGEVHLAVDIRLAGDETQTDVEAFLAALLHDLPVEITVRWYTPTSFSRPGTEVWHSLERAVRGAYPDGGLVPSLFTGGTDGRYFRFRGIPTYGFGVLSRAMPPERYWSLFHGHDERIDTESLRLSTDAWEHVALDYLAGNHGSPKLM